MPSLAPLRPLLIAAILAIAGGCGPRVPNATPEGAVRELVERLRLVNGDPADAKAVFALLSKRAQANLVARAKRYSDASGKNIAPEAMIAPARLVLHLEPQRYSAKISGTYALVDITGALPEDHAQVPCIFEDDAWRVDLTLPALPPVQMRPGAGG
ncbi:MAG: hypothetical protein U0359_04040 [Byssovorax sp.]